MTGLPHEKLDAWSESIKLVKEVYAATERFPASEHPGLRARIRKVSVGVPAHIAQGAARQSDAEFLRFLHIAWGSLSELETLLLIAVELGFLEQPVFEQVTRSCQRIGRLLDGVIRSLQAKVPQEGPAGS